MRVVIDIPEEIYNRIIKDEWNTTIAGFACCHIAEGIPLPKGHGDLVDRDEVHTLHELIRIPPVIPADKGE